jgi:tol-pal system protein YbgF
MNSSPRLLVFITIVTAGIFISGYTPAGADVRRDLNDLKQSSYQYKKDISDNRKSISALRAELEKLKANFPQEQSMQSIRSSQTTLLTRVNDLHEEVQSLMGQVERELNQTKKLSRQTAADLDVVKASGAGSADLEKRLAALELELALIKKKLEKDSSGVRPPSEEDTKGAVKSPYSPENQYKTAYDLYKDRKYQKARESFKEFLMKYKDHKWAGNAQFWIGETYYAEKTYDRAILSYDDVVRKYPKSNKVPDAMLKQGYAFIKLKDPLASKGVLRALVQKYPDSRAADHAREKLKSLK